MVVVYSREAKRKREKEGERESILFELLIKVCWYYISDESSFLS